MNTASEPSDETPLHIIRRFTQYYRNDYAGTEEFAQDGETGVIDARTVRKQKDFAEFWSRNLQEQGFGRCGCLCHLQTFRWLNI